MIRLTDEKDWTLGPCAVALGMFDGVHIGHAQLIDEANRLAQAQGLVSAVYTFDTHPLAVLRPQGAPPALCTPQEKADKLAALGLGALVMRPFDKSLAEMSAEDFVAHLAKALQPREVIVGFNYSFGARGVGDAALLTRLGERLGFRTRVMPPVCWQGEPVSSSRIRAALTAGEMDAVRDMLGGAYTISGVVAHGKRIGRTLGFPTANLSLPNGKALPPYGVYAAWARTQAQRYPAVMNIGAHPTAPEGAPTAEVYLLDADVALYDQPLTATLEKWLRPERRFDSLDALKAQIGQDVEVARRCLQK